MSCLFQIRKKKGVLLVLLWFFASVLILEELTLSRAIPISPAVAISSKAGTFTSFLVYPLFGWLADARYGRYRVVKFSLLGLWASSIIYGLVLALLQLLHAAGRLGGGVVGKQQIVGMVWYTMSGLGLGGLLANVVQLGIDQLQENSSSEIASFLRWSGVIWLATLSLVQLVHRCLSAMANSVVVSTLLSFVLCSDYFCSSWLVKEPGTSSALGTVAKVMRFVAKNKYPRLRSTYPYWTQGICSRISFAKTMFGGPFTDTQVEDTISFLRILPFIGLASLVSGTAVQIQADIINVRYDFNGIPDGKECSVNFMLKYLIDITGTMVVCVIVVLLELLPCSRMRRYIDTTPTLKRAGLGIVLLLLAVFTCAGLEAVGTQLNANGVYTNSTCFFDLSEFRTDRVLLLSYLWTIIPNVLWACALYLATIAFVEFHCAQTPYSVKGLIFGMYFGGMGVSYAVFKGLLVPIKIGIRSWEIIAVIGCGTLYFLCLLVVLLFLSSTFWFCYKYYKPRLRTYRDATEGLVQDSYYGLDHQASDWSTS